METAKRWLGRIDYDEPPEEWSDAAIWREFHSGCITRQYVVDEFLKSESDLWEMGEEFSVWIRKDMQDEPTKYNICAEPSVEYFVSPAEPPTQ